MKKSLCHHRNHQSVLLIQLILVLAVFLIPSSSSSSSSSSTLFVKVYSFAGLFRPPPTTTKTTTTVSQLIPIPIQQPATAQGVRPLSPRRDLPNPTTARCWDNHHQPGWGGCTSPRLTGSVLSGAEQWSFTLSNT